MKLRLLLGLIAAASAAAQEPAPASSKDSGQTISPVFEGWYKNADGSFSLSFGYFSRNAVEQVDVPIGPANNISPGAANQGQPTHFHPKRHWGVFAVKVPADFGVDKKVVWTVTFRGKTYAIPGHLKPNWEIDALEGEASTGNTPPVVRFDSNGTAARGPGGAYGAPMRAKVGTPLAINLFVQDDGKEDRSIASNGRANVPIGLTLFLHQGPAPVTFGAGPVTAEVPVGKAVTSATFSKPGDYILRVRANDASGVDGAGHAQCCWTNAFVKVTVTP